MWRPCRPDMWTNVNGCRSTRSHLRVHNWRFVCRLTAYSQLNMSKIKLIISPPFKPSAYPHFFISATDLTRLTLLVSKVQVTVFLNYAFICLHQVIGAAHGCFDLHCRYVESLAAVLQDLVPWPGIKLGFLHREHKLLATGSPGKSLKSLLTFLFSSSRSCHLHSNSAKPLACMFLL